MYEFGDGDGRNGDDYPRESSPSTGPEETVAVMDAGEGADHTPTCDAPECDRPGDPVTVRDDTHTVRESLRCDSHAKDFLEVSA